MPAAPILITHQPLPCGCMRPLAWKRWRLAADRSRARSEAGKAVAARKADELIERAEQLPITVTRLPLDQLQKRAIASYNAFHEEVLWERVNDYEKADAQSDPAFLSRITVNY